MTDKKLASWLNIDAVFRRADQDYKAEYVACDITTRARNAFGLICMTKTLEKLQVKTGMYTRYSYKMPDLTCSVALTTIYVVKHKTANSKYAMLVYNPLVLIVFQNLNNSL